MTKSKDQLILIIILGNKNEDSLNDILEDEMNQMSPRSPYDFNRVGNGQNDSPKERSISKLSQAHSTLTSNRQDNNRKLAHSVTPKNFSSTLQNNFPNKVNINKTDKPLEEIL